MSSPKHRPHLVILDLDDTLLQTGLTSTFVVHLARHWVSQGLYDMPEMAEADILNTFRISGCSPTEMARRHGFDSTWVDDCYAHICQCHLPDALAVITPNPELQQQLAALRQSGYHFGLLTQSHRVYSYPVLEKAGLLDFLEPDLIFDWVSSQSSKRFPQPYERLLAALHTPPDEIWMVEDSPANLPPAKTLGFRTVLVGHQQPTPEQAPSIDATYPDVQAFLNTLPPLTADHAATCRSA